MTSLRELHDRGHQLLAAGEVSSALALFRLVHRAAPTDFSTRLTIADSLLRLGEPQMAGQIYTAVAVYGIKAGLPLLATVAVKLLKEAAPEIRGLDRDLALLYSKDSPRVGRGVRPAPVDLQQTVSHEEPVPPLDDAVDRLELAQSAAELDPQLVYPETVPPYPLFSELGVDALQRVIRAMELRRYSDGSWVIRQGDPGDEFFVVARGRVSVVRQAEGDQQQVLAQLGEGSILGEMAVLAAEPRMASVVAVGATDLLVFTRQTLAAMADELPLVGALLERFATERMVRNLINTTPLFAPFSPEQRQALFQRFEAHKLPRGTIVVRQDEEGRGIYVVLYGAVEVIRAEPSGEEFTLATLTSGESFGEISCVQDRPTTALVRTVRDSAILFLPKEHFLKLVEALPEVGDYYLDLGVQRLIEIRRAAAQYALLVSNDGVIRL